MSDLLWRIFGRATVDLDLVARVLAHRILDGNNGDSLPFDEYGTTQQLKTAYVRIAIETGLPVNAQSEVARRAWAYIAKAQEDEQPDPETGKEFSFYA
jgi:hypothetical protein